MSEVNYTVEMENILKTNYDPEDSEANRDAQIKEIAEAVGRSAQSVRAKLTRMGLYVPKAPKTEKAPRITKAQIVRYIAQAMDVSEEAIESLEKANKSTLTLIVSYLSQKS